MLKKTVTYLLMALVLIIFGGYFAAASILARKGGEKELCTGISVTIADSSVNRFVSGQDIQDIITSSGISPLGRRRAEVNLHDIETLLESRSAIKSSEASISRDGNLRITVTQRRPVLRIQTPAGAFYVDDTGYIFPWVSTFTSYVPVISGHIPVRLEEGYRGVPEQSDRKWIERIISLASYLGSHPAWNAQIQQIYVESNGDLVFYNVIGDQKIIFGAVDDIAYKFEKLRIFYNSIVPVYGWERYSAVNLKFSDQIICTLRDKKDIRKSAAI
ncbi:MAG TPA: hypothetical protein IAC03_01995 [Candidatus Coprenecus pullistercoris]|nr:hypothetical protein [Candidatus Coprenecus pullistercoris]